MTNYLLSPTAYQLRFYICLHEKIAVKPKTTDLGEVKCTFIITYGCVTAQVVNQLNSDIINRMCLLQLYQLRAFTAHEEHDQIIRTIANFSAELNNLTDLTMMLCA